MCRPYHPCRISPVHTPACHSAPATFQQPVSPSIVLHPVCVRAVLALHPAVVRPFTRSLPPSSPVLFPLSPPILVHPFVRYCHLTPTPLTVKPWSQRRRSTTRDFAPSSLSIPTQPPRIKMLPAYASRCTLPLDVIFS